MKYLFIVFCSQILALVSAQDAKAQMKEMKAKFCDHIPTEEMKIEKGQAIKKKCKALQAECMGKAEGEKDTCWNAKIKQLTDDANAKFCDDLPADMIQKCKDAKGKCAAKSGDEKDECRGAMQDAVREKMKANFCDRVPAGMKQKCMAAKAACKANDGKDMGGKRPVSGKGSGVGKDGKKGMGAKRPVGGRGSGVGKDGKDMGGKRPVSGKGSGVGKDGKKDMGGKRPVSGKGSGVGKDGKKGMGGMMGGTDCWKGKIRAMIGMIGKGDDGKGPGGKGPGGKDGKDKPTGPKRKPRKVAEKGSNCAAIPEKAKLSKDNCVTLKMSLFACANKAGLADKIKKCAQLRNLKTKQIKRKLVKFAQKVKGIDFGKDDEATKKKKAKYEKAVLKLYKAISGVFTYTKDTSRMRRKLQAGVTYSVTADLTTDTDAEADGASAVDAAAVSAELKNDEDFKDVEVQAANVKLQEVDVEEIVEEVPANAVDAPVDAAASTTTALVLGLVSMMAF